MYSTVLFPMQDLGGINHFCLTPFSTLHLKEKEWYFGNVFLVPFGNINVIISHVTTKVGVVIKINEINFSKFV